MGVYPGNILYKISTENSELSSFTPLISFIVSKITVYFETFDETDKQILNYLLENGESPNTFCNRIQNTAFTLFCNGYIFMPPKFCSINFTALFPIVSV